MEWHVWDFPDNIYVQLEEDFRKSLFIQVIKILGNKSRVARFLGIHRATLREWFNGRRVKRNKIYTIYTPVYALRKILLLLEGYSKFSAENIEKHITAYRLPSGNSILNPKLPIKETPELIAIIAHLFGDGSASNKKGSCPSFTNFIQARMRFIRLLNKYFGKVPVNHNKDFYVVQFTKVISELLRYWYNIESFNSLEARLPRKFFNLPRQFLIEIVKSFIIDEGSVKNSCVEIYSQNSLLLNDIREICLMLNYKCSRISKPNNPTSAFSFSILSDSLESVLKDMKNLVIPHKQKALIQYMKRRNRSWKLKPHGVTKKAIIQLLEKEGSLSAKEIGYQLNISPSTINDYHLSRLKRVGKVKIIDKNNFGGYVWDLN